MITSAMVENRSNAGYILFGIINREGSIMSANPSHINITQSTITITSCIAIIHKLPQYCAPPLLLPYV